jgi:hypothetical protein
VDERPDAAELACPECGAPYEPEQEYCLECGRRLPVSRMPTPRPRRWIWVGLALAIVVAGAIIGLVAAADSGEEAAALTTTSAEPPPSLTTSTGPDLGETGALSGFETVTLPPPNATLPPTTATLPGLTVTPPGTTAAPTTTVPPTTTQPGGGLVQWPAGQDGYTVVLASVVSSQGRAAADAQAARARAAGLPQVGVLESSSYSSLRPGFWVVFSGIYSSEAQARAATPSARAKGYPDAYPRRVAD